MLVLAFPVTLYFLGIPNSGFSDDRLKKMVGTDPTLGATNISDVAKKEGVVMRFSDLNDAALDPAKREALQGQSAVLEGLFKRLGDREFTLFRMKMTCCAADTVPLKVRIVTPTALSGFKDMDWVEVQGQVHFLQVPNSNQYVPVIKVADVGEIKKVDKKNVYE